MWLTYNSNSKQLFCYLCLSFSNESNLFTTGMSSWKYVYQRINEHESSKVHNHCVEAYNLFTQNCDINTLLFSVQKDKRKEEFPKNREVFKRIIDYVLFIAKRGLSYRGNKFEAAYSLNSLHDHGNFLDLLLLLSNYDPVIKDHLDTITQKSKKAKYIKDMDLLKSQELVDIALEKLVKIQRDMDGVNLSGDVFVQQMNSELHKFNLDIVVEEHFPKIRSRKRKILPGELAEDYIINDQLNKFTVDVHNKILDTIVESMRRFLKHRDLYTDLSCLSPTNFKVITEQGLSNIPLTTLSNKLIQFNKNASDENIKNELISFAENWNKLKKSIPETYATIYMKNNNKEVLIDTQKDDNDSTIFSKSC